jgi:hypothetical protein
MVVPLAQKSGEICTGQVILQPIPLKTDRLLAVLEEHPARHSIAFSDFFPANGII